MNGNHADSVMAQDGLTARRTCRAGAKAEHSEPTIRLRRGGRSTDKSYPGDNRLVSPESSYRRRCSAPRCRLILSWGWRRSQGFGCSPIKKSRELGSDRSESEQILDIYNYILYVKNSVSEIEQSESSRFIVFCRNLNKIKNVDKPFQFSDRVDHKEIE